MKELRILGVPDAIKVRYGVIDGDEVLVRADFNMFVTAKLPADKATPDVVAEVAGRVVAMLVMNATKALNPELGEEPEQAAPAEEAKPS